MRGQWARWLAWLAALLSAPHASAEHYFVEDKVEVGLDEAVETVVHQYMGKEAAAIRDHIDEDHGNNDNIVTPAEVASYRAHHRITYREVRTDCYEDFDRVRLDDRPPVHAVERVEILEGATGRNDSTAPIILRIVTRYQFPASLAGRLEASVDMEGPGLDEMDDQCVVATPGREPQGFGDGFSHWAWWFDVWPDNEEDGVEVRHVVRPLGGVRFEATSVQPAFIGEYWDGSGWSEAAAGAPVARNEIRFTVVAAKIAPSSNGIDAQAAAAIGIPVSLLLAAGLVWYWESSRLRILSWFFAVPGFTRIEEDEVLLNRRRGDLLLRIRESPGLCFSDLRRASEIPNGPLVYHLQVLEARGHVKSLRDGRRTRYFPRIPGASFAIPLNPAQLALLEAVKSFPGLAQNQLATRLGWSRLAVHRQARRLVKIERLRIIREGRLRRYFPGLTATVRSWPGDSTVADSVLNV